MKLQKNRILALLLTLCLLLPMAVLAEAAPSIAITDMTGRELVLGAPAAKVVALAASDCEILYAIGAGDTLVGRGEYCDYPAEVVNVPSVQSGYDMNLEQIVALAPDLVIMNTMDQSVEQVEALENAGIPVLASTATDVNGVYDAITMIAAATGHDAEGEALVSSMKASLSDLAAKADGDGTKTVYFEVSPLQYGLWTAGAGTFMNEIAELLGLKNCFDDVTGWAQISEEQVLTRNPDYIVTISMYYGEGPTPTEEILARAGWENIPAVKNEKILNLVDNELSRPAPRLTEGAQALYDFVYGAAE